jgi:hypothetical protein
VYCSSPLLDEDYMVRYNGQNPTPPTSGDAANGLYPLKIDRSLWFSTKVTNATDPCQS